jgi:hypothetical protein
MIKPGLVLPPVVAAGAVALALSACSSAPAAKTNLTVSCSENLTGVDVTDGGVSGTGHCTIAGLVHDGGPTTDYRTLKGVTAYIRRVIAGKNGTLTFMIAIPISGPGGETWTITSGTKTYAGLRGRGLQVVDNYTGTPATFVLTGNVSLGSS